MALDSSTIIDFFFGVRIRLLTECKICFTLGLFANFFSSKIT